MTQNRSVEISGLSKRYGRVVALDAIDLDLFAGSFTGLVGPNGAGKSTLLKLLLRLEAPDRGDALVLGRSIHSDHRDFNLEVGYVSEETRYRMPGSLANLTDLLSRLHPRWDARRFDTISSDFGLDPSRSFDALSRGRKIQFAFAAAWACRPRLMILDEVTAILDPSLRMGVLAYLKTFRDEGGTVLLATNVLSEIQNAADRLIILDKGQIRFDQPARTFDEQFMKLRRTSRVEDAPFARGDCREVGLNSDGSISYLVPRGPDASALAPYEDRRGVTPEDLFIYHTKKAG